MNETEARDSAWAWPSVDRWRDTSTETSASNEPATGAAASPSSSATNCSTSSTNTRSVLIVEDDRAARTAISKLLKRRGFAVSEAATVADALAGIGRAPAPQWVLLDLMLPDGCGISVLDQIRAAELPCTVCVITGCDSHLLNLARRAGAEHAFTKPLDVERLMNVMCA